MMNLEKEYEKALSMREHKETFEAAFYLFEKVAAELEDCNNGLTQSEQKMLIDCYSQMYLISWSGASLTERTEYVDRMIQHMTDYMEKYPEDIMVCDGCFFVMLGALYYDELYSWVTKLYKQGDAAKKLALSWFGNLFWSGYLDEEEYAPYRQEYKQLVSEAKQTSPKQEE